MTYETDGRRVDPSSGPVPRLTVGVVGATGYTGRELCRLLLSHPAVARILPASRTDLSFEHAHPSLFGCGLEFISTEYLIQSSAELDVVFFCTPPGHAMVAAPGFLQRDVRVIDLSPDFRFTDPSTYERVYGQRHVSPDLLARAVCGITEINRDAIRVADLVANPGCYVITAVIAMAPLFELGLVEIERGVHIVALNGTTGAGSEPVRELQHAEVVGALLAYSLEGHRHGPELGARLAELALAPVPIDFATIHGDFARGIHLQASVPVREDVGAAMTRELLLSGYRDRYGSGHDGEFFVLVHDRPKRGGLNAKEYSAYPSLRHVVGTNYCRIGVDWHTDGRTVRLVAVTDNLGKGASGSAVQNMNVMLGIDETAGLRGYAL